MNKVIYRGVRSPRATYPLPQPLRPARQESHFMPVYGNMLLQSQIRSAILFDRLGLSV